MSKAEKLIEYIVSRVECCKQEDCNEYVAEYDEDRFCYSFRVSELRTLLKKYFKENP